jgi:uncharacterized membrane protein YhhN
MDLILFASTGLLCAVYFAVPNFFNKAIPIWYLGGNCLMNSTWYSLLVGIGLLFSSGGDVSLELDDGDIKYFICGLLCFLVAHLLYIAAFTSIKIIPSKAAAIIGMICIIYYTIMMTLLLPVVGRTLMLPVMVYAATICAMMFTAANRFFGKSDISYFSRYSALLGALLFVASDTILALNKFLGPIENAKRMVMVTYYLAQIFIALSASRKSNKTTNEEYGIAN